MKLTLTLILIGFLNFSCIDEESKVKQSIKYKPKQETKSKILNPKIKLFKRSINTSSISVRNGNKIEIEGTIELLLPSGFETMPRETIKLKYPSAARPSSVYTNKEGTVNIALNHTITPMDNQGVDAYKIQFEGQLIQMGAKLIKSESIVKNGKNQVILEFISRAMDGYIYNLFVISHMDNPPDFYG